MNWADKIHVAPASKASASTKVKQVSKRVSRLQDSEEDDDDDEDDEESSSSEKGDVDDNNYMGTPPTRRQKNGTSPHKPPREYYPSFDC
jgi:hypothetical protein